MLAEQMGLTHQLAQSSSKTRRAPACPLAKTSTRTNALCPEVAVAGASRLNSGVPCGSPNSVQVTCTGFPWYSLNGNDVEQAVSGSICPQLTKFFQVVDGNGRFINTLNLQDVLSFIMEKERKLQA